MKTEKIKFEATVEISYDDVRDRERLLRDAQLGLAAYSMGGGGGNGSYKHKTVKVTRICKDRISLKIHRPK